MFDKSNTVRKNLQTLLVAEALGIYLVVVSRIGAAADGDGLIDFPTTLPLANVLHALCLIEREGG